jgi:hypothetical protein
LISKKKEEEIKILKLKIINKKKYIKIKIN